MDVIDLETFIRPWYWDDGSHAFAREAGAFVLQFVRHLQAAGLSDEALQKHQDNAWLVGAFLCQYDYRETFSPAAFLNKPLFIDDFRFRMKDFPTEVASYEDTYRRLERYVRAFGYGDDL